MNDFEIEKAYPRTSKGDKEGEYNYLISKCGNMWYSVVKNPMYRNNCICPKCRKVIKVIMLEDK